MDGPCLPASLAKFMSETGITSAGVPFQQGVLHTLSSLPRQRGCQHLIWKEVVEAAGNLKYIHQYGVTSRHVINRAG